MGVPWLLNERNEISHCQKFIYFACLIEMNINPKQIYGTRRCFKKVVHTVKNMALFFPLRKFMMDWSCLWLWPEGVELKKQYQKYWWDSMTLLHENVVGIVQLLYAPYDLESFRARDAFNDPLIDNKDSKKIRADVLIEDYLAKMMRRSTKEVAKSR